MSLEIDKSYEFKILSKQIKDGKSFSIIQDCFGQTHYYPQYLDGEFINLTVNSFLDGKYHFNEYRDINLKRKLDLRKYEIGKIYPFKFLEIEKPIDEKPTVKNSKIIITDMDGFTKFKLLLFKWQLSPIYNPDIIFCEVNKIENNKLFLKQSVDKLKHPLFEVGKEYEFDFISTLDNDNEINENERYIIVKGIDGIERSLFKPFDNEYLKGDKIKYFYFGINQKGSLIFRQFVSFEKIVKFRALKRLTYDIFRNTEDNPIITKLFNDYDNKQNLWVISFCSILEDELGRNLENNQFEQALIYVEVLIEFEKWILNSGFLFTFKDNIEQREETARTKLEEFEIYKIALEVILEEKQEKYLSQVIFQLKENDEINLSLVRIIIVILKFNSNVQPIRDELIIEFILLLCENDFFSKFEKEKNQILSLIQSICKSLDDNIFNFVFTNTLKRDKYFINNSTLAILIKFLTLHILILKNCKSENFMFLCIIKYFRYQSLYFNDKEIRYRLIELAINIAFNNSNLKDIVILFNWSNFENLVTAKCFLCANLIEERNRIHNSATLKNLMENKRNCTGQIIGIDKFGYRIKINNDIAILPKSRFHDCNIINWNYNANKDIEVIVDNIDEHFGKILVSQICKEDFKNSQEIVEGAIIEGIVKRFESYGAFIDLGDYDGLLHKKEISIFFVSHPSEFLTLREKLRLKVIRKQEICGKTQIDLSLKDVMSDETPQLDQVYRSRICKISESGLDIKTSNNLYGFVKAKSALYQDVPFEVFFKCGEFINVKLTKINKDNSLLFKLQEFENPFKKTNLFINKVFQGTVFNISENAITVKFRDHFLIGKQNREIDGENYHINTIDLNDFVNFTVKEVKSDSKTIIISIDYSSVIKNELVYNLENIDNLINIEIGNCYENYAFLLEKSYDRINYLTWSKYFFSLGSSAKSYYLGSFIDYQAIINGMDVKKNQINNLNKVIEDTNLRANSLIKTIEEQTLSTQIFPNLKHIKINLQIINCFGNPAKEKLTFLFSLIENNHSDLEYELLEKAAKLVLSFNLMNSEINNQINKHKCWQQLYEFLREGLLKIETEDESEILLRNNLVKLIEQGENRKVEFKASLRKPVHDRKKREILINFKDQLKIAKENANEKDITYFKNKIEAFENASTKSQVIHSAMKTLAAFANSNGGNLIIGLEDDKNILGIDIDIDAFKDIEKALDDYTNVFDSLVSKYIGTNFNQYINSCKTVRIDNKILFWISVNKSNIPIFLKLDDKSSPCKDFYIRAQVSSRKLDMEEFIKYYNEQFSKNE